MDELKKLNDNIKAITRIKEREFPEQTIPVKASIREAIDIFYKVNASGVALTDAELALAQISGYWPQARDRFKSKLDRDLRTVAESPQPFDALLQVIAEGESDELQFKLTLRWDLKEGTLNKKLEEVILKTVAAFANSQGGTLLVVVTDEGEVLGLEWDYHSLGGGDRDTFELHLRNLLNQQFGTGFVTSKIAIKFHLIEDKEVCQIETLPRRSQ